MPPLTPGTNKKMTEALKASFASWEKEQERLGIPKGNNYISILFFLSSSSFISTVLNTTRQHKRENLSLKKIELDPPFQPLETCCCCCCCYGKRLLLIQIRGGPFFCVPPSSPIIFLSSIFFGFFPPWRLWYPYGIVCVCWNKKVNISASLIPGTEAHETNRPQSSLVFHRGVMGGGL